MIHTEETREVLRRLNAAAQAEGRLVLEEDVAPTAVEEAVEQICRVAGVEPPDAIGVAIGLPESARGIAMHATAPEANRTAIFVHMDFDTAYPPDEMYAILSHEIGHHVLAHPKPTCREDSWRSEFEADAFALKLGMGDALARALQRYGGEKEDSDSHPATAERVRRLKDPLRVLKSALKEAA